MKSHIETIPQDIIDEYNLLSIVDNQGFVYVNIVKGMYGLKQAGIIAHKSLIHHLALFGYHPDRHAPGLWQHETRDTIFTLVVDDFSIKYTSPDNAQHLLHASKEKYTISEDWEAKLYIGITLKWDYSKQTIDLSMPGYVTAALQRLLHQQKTPGNHPHTTISHQHTAPEYNLKNQRTIHRSSQKNDSNLSSK